MSRTSRSSHRRFSDASNDGDSDYTRHSLPKSRRAESLNSRGRRPDLAEQKSYHRPSRSERRYTPNIDSDSESSDNDSYSRRYNQSHGHRGRSSSIAPSSNYSSPSRTTHSADHHHSRRRSPSPSNRRRPASTFPVSARDQKDRDHDSSSRHYPPSASRSHRTQSSRPSSSRQGENPSRPPRPRRNSSSIILGASRTALEAGAVAALKLRDDPSPWLGTKGAKVVTAALSAAAVDTFMERRHPDRKGGLRHTVMKQGMQVVIGNLVKKPAAQAEDMKYGEKVEQKVKGGIKGGVKKGVKMGAAKGVKAGGEKIMNHHHRR
ncbi:hypothetical protein B0T14DRAFT_493755 [Immersiella caudata]|uniref:Uncharacterized protein n=1 Tax=Immersiella caudata TaxID=314043 RepID=A0AA39X692_9PEZI|nr:hypothetical protein B0T14DRAFT_493755 [Immersiella caudata]